MSTYEDKVTDPSNRRMRKASGEVDDDRPLVAFLYKLARDHVTTGVLEGFIDQLKPQPTQFTNGWLAGWAKDAADRLTGEL